MSSRLKTQPGVVAHICNPSIVLWRWRQKNQELKASLDYITSLCPKTNTKRSKTKSPKQNDRLHNTAEINVDILFISPYACLITSSPCI
jgi:hypothetical protein